MTRRAVGAGVLQEAAVCIALAAGPCVAQELPPGSIVAPVKSAAPIVGHLSPPVAPLSAPPPAIRSAAIPNSPRQRELQYAAAAKSPRVELFQTAVLSVSAGSWPLALDRRRNWLRVELDRARAQGEEWLRDAGFSLLEQRDADGRRTYSVLSSTLVADGPIIQVHARLGRPELSAGLTVRRDRPAIGITIPWQQYTIEMEGVEDQEVGYMLMGRVRWSDPQRRLQFGIALPVGLDDGLSVGALFQVRGRFGK